jgi:hypothetical protein
MYNEWYPHLMNGFMVSPTLSRCIVLFKLTVDHNRFLRYSCHISVRRYITSDAASSNEMLLARSPIITHIRSEKIKVQMKRKYLSLAEKIKKGMEKTS